MFGIVYMYQSRLNKYEDRVYNANSLNELINTIQEEKIYKVPPE